MKKFWEKLGKGLAKGAVWAVGNVDEVLAIVAAIKKAKG